MDQAAQLIIEIRYDDFEYSLDEIISKLQMTLYENIGIFTKKEVNVIKNEDWIDMSKLEKFNG